MKGGSVRFSMGNIVQRALFIFKGENESPKREGEVPGSAWHCRATFGARVEWSKEKTQGASPHNAKGAIKLT